MAGVARIAALFAADARMSLDPLIALSPLDGRYAGKVEPLRGVFSEYGLIARRVRVEVEWLIALGDEPAIPEVPRFEAAAPANATAINKKIAYLSKRMGENWVMLSPSR